MGEKFEYKFFDAQTVDELNAIGADGWFPADRLQESYGRERRWAGLFVRRVEAEEPASMVTESRVEIVPPPNVPDCPDCGHSAYMHPGRCFTAGCGCLRTFDELTKSPTVELAPVCACGHPWDKHSTAGCHAPAVEGLCYCGAPHDANPTSECDRFGQPNYCPCNLDAEGRPVRMFQDAPVPAVVTPGAEAASTPKPEDDDDMPF